MKTPGEILPHSLPAPEVERQLETSSKSGLNIDEVENRLKKFGNNSIAEKKKISPLLIFFHQFKSPIVLLLLVAAGLSLWFQEWLNAIAIFVVILINALIGFYMEFQAARSMKALKKLSSAPAKVLRKNRLEKIDSENIVPGDIVFVEAGDLVPADGRIIKLSQLQADESALTGESVPVNKQSAPLPTDTTVADRLNMLYKGTFISKGNSTIVVTGTGMSTELGKVASLVDSAEQSATPLEKKLQQFSRKLIKITVALVVVIFTAGMINGKNVIEMLQTSIALAVAAIPEGLPIVATMALAQGMLRMARHQVIVKKLSAVETLGGTNVLCVDKTGTLTRNKIEVKEIFPSAKEAEDIIKEISILCNTAELHLEKDQLKEIGDPLETGLLKFYSKDGKLVGDIRRQFPKIKEEPFSSETKLMATLHKTKRGLTAYAKGATEELIERSSRLLTGNGEQTLDDRGRQYWHDQAEKLAASGLRVIAAAYKIVQSEKENITEDLVFCGLIGMIDPPADDVAAAVADCHSAGINIIMITGDHPSTAKNIARQLKITNDRSAEVVTGKKMKNYEELSEDEKTTWANTRVFARVSPKQKLDIVKVLQEKKFTVGMTGDGINDAPALKKADIGIAMGKRGTQVAQEVADMVIKDDSFASIVLAVRQGRIIFENIRKFVIFLLSCNLSELLVISTASIFNLHFQLFALQILFINLVTDVFPALALGITDGNPNIMKMKPRDESEPVIDKKRWTAILFYSIIISAVSIAAVLISHYIIHRSQDWNAQVSNNILFFTLIFAQLLHVLNMGSTGSSFFSSEVFRSKYVWYSIAVSAVILMITCLTVPIRQVLMIYPLPAIDWLVCAGAAISSTMIIQLAKKLKLVVQ
jgi:P-type Ca2+ transporter type 2C